MPETPTPTQDLAALDRVTVIAAEAGRMSDGLAVVLELLRTPITLELDRRRALGKALAAEWKWGENELVAEIDKATDRVLAAIASVGAEIVWPSPEPSDRPAESPTADTAPETVATAPTFATTGPHIIATAWAAENLGFPADPKPGERAWSSDGVEWVFCPDGIWEQAERTARERILAEVAAIDLSRTPPGLTLSEIVTNAAGFVRDAVPGIGMYKRHNLVHAAAMLLHAVERMDNADE